MEDFSGCAVIGASKEHLVRLGLFFSVGAAAVCATLGDCASRLDQELPEATVTIEDVYYIFPWYWNVGLQPRNPLCLKYKDVQIVVAGRKLFINSVLAYQAKRFDKVYVDYPLGVIVDGRIVRTRRYEVLDDGINFLCDWRSVADLHLPRLPADRPD
jgi:hypothetical protein